MAAFLATSSCPSPTISASAGIRSSTSHQTRYTSMGVSFFSGLKHVPGIRLTTAGNRFSTQSRCVKTAISCSIAEPETLKAVQTTIAKQLSIDMSSVTPETKFAELGADSLDTVEIMMALEEQFGVSVGEGGAENIATVQDAANLIEKVKAVTD